MDKQKPIGSQVTFMTAEMRFLNSIFRNSSLLDNPLVDKELLYHSECKSLYKALENLRNKKLSFTESSWIQEATNIDLNITDSMVRAIINCEEQPLTDNDIQDICKSLENAKRGRAVVESLNNLTKKILDNPTKIDEYKPDIEKALSKVESDILETQSVKRLENLKETLSKYEEAYSERRHGKKYLFNNPIMDKIVKSGASPGSGGLIAASTGMGKSAFCLNLINGFIKSEIPTIYYSLEMGRVDTIDRLLALRQGIPMDAIINPQDEAEFESILDSFREERKELEQNTKFRFSESAFVSLDQVKSDIKKFKQEEGIDYCIVVFDLLSMIKDFTILENGLNFAQGIEVAINRLNGLAKELGFHYIAVLQLNRKVEEGQVQDLDDIEKFRPTRNAVKNSGAFLERCRWNIGLFRPKYFAEQYLEKEQYENLDDYCYIYMLKQNQGGVGKSGKFLFAPQFMRMTPVLDDEFYNNDEEEDS